MARMKLEVMMRMMETTNSLSNNKWWESDWYKKQQHCVLSDRELMGPSQKIPSWMYYSEYGELKFVYM